LRGYRVTGGTTGALVVADRIGMFAAADWRGL
jgi:hypothetical protein